MHVQSLGRQTHCGRSFVNRFLGRELAHRTPTEIEANSPGRSLCFRRLRLCTRLLVGTLYAAIAILASGAGVWAGLRASLPRLVDDPSFLQNVGHDTRSRMTSVNDILADVGLPADYAPIGLIKSDGNLFAVFVNHMGAIRSSARISGGGSADVFDHEGHLLQHYAVIEHTDFSWESWKYERLSPR